MTPSFDIAFESEVISDTLEISRKLGPRTLDLITVWHVSYQLEPLFVVV